ncbi:ATP-binding protein [Ancylobacter defluvii]|uniref:histidine kinase n=1 Tax=Ancylobacter defluvii TaxID=1282440 RepID=A0A9W6JYI0_9HYPH|nr:ATP-binding protein [Ancylobacter defluvii]MBS7589293.1 sensor histidine kinase [Ancylobacter defluvii]GLK84906.1 ATPase [Ancylobacter defluvii]
MRSRSLALRLFVSATLVIVAVLAVTGFVLSTAYQQAVERAFDRRLDVYLKTIVADVANSTAGQMPEPTTLGDPIFSFPLSGWYWQITRLDRTAKEVKTSRSMPEGTLPLLVDKGTGADLTGLREDYAKGPAAQRLRIVERVVDLGEDGRYAIAVAADAGEIDDEVEGFDTALIVTLAVLGLVFLMTVAFQVLFGLRPLKRMLTALAAVREGRAERLEGDYPVEVAPVVAEMNALIDTNREIVERARTHVGNLAHALKTPISVLQNEAGRMLAGTPDSVLATKVQEQAEVMKGQVAHHLERARIAARAQVVTTVEEVGPVVEKLAASLGKVYRRRGIDVETEIAGGARFRGERQDLEEIIGNLVDNGCKWARTLVEVSVGPAVEGPGRRAVFEIVIDDDGPGLTEAQRGEAMKRGRRLDETQPGSGLGLSIVSELVGLYGGSLALDRSPFGGLRCVVRLPAA